MFYAQLDNNNICIGVSKLNSKVDLLSMVEIGSYDMSLLRKKYENGKWVAVAPPTPTLEEAKQNKIAELTQEYEKVIYNTFNSNAFDGTTQETYSCSQTDQTRINGGVTMAMAVKAGFSQEPISWKNVNQDKCVVWTADSMIKLGTDLHKFVTKKTDYLEALTSYVNSLTSIDDVNKITWGMAIPAT